MTIIQEGVVDVVFVSQGVVCYCVASPSKHQPRIFWRLQVDGGLPELDRVGDHLQRLSENAAPHPQIGLERGSL